MATKKDEKHITIVLPGVPDKNGVIHNRFYKCLAKKGKSLKNIVHPIFDKQGISFSSHSLFLDISTDPLPIGSESVQYPGHVIHVRNVPAEIENRIVHTMKMGKKIRIEISSGFFKLLEQEEEPSLASSVADSFELESSWRDVVSHDEMDEREKAQQAAVWELLETEVQYIKDINVIIEVFAARFDIIQRGGYMREVERKHIFSNIREVYDSNIKLWRRLAQVLEETRKTKRPIRPSQLQNAFADFEYLFHPYIEFCNSDTCNFKLPEYSESTSVMVKEFFTWCDDHPDCRRITMVAFLIKPMQRVTKYSLLLKAIMNKTDDVEEKSIVEGIMSRVETFVSKINHAIHLRQEQEKMNNVVKRITEYSAIESLSEEVEKLTREFCNMDLKEPIISLQGSCEERFLLEEGPMKVSNATQGKRDLYAFLFNDMLLLTKSTKKNAETYYRVVSSPYFLDRINLRNTRDGGSMFIVYTDEYDLLTDAFVVHFEAADKWRTSLQKAKEEYEILREKHAEEVRNDMLVTPPSQKKENIIRRQTSSLMMEEKKKKLLKFSRTTILHEKPRASEHKHDWDIFIVLIVILFFFANRLVSKFLG